MPVVFGTVTAAGCVVVVPVTPGGITSPEALLLEEELPPETTRATTTAITATTATAPPPIQASRTRCFLARSLARMASIRAFRSSFSCRSAMRPPPGHRHAANGRASPTKEDRTRAKSRPHAAGVVTGRKKSLPGSLPGAGEVSGEHRDHQARG